MKYAIYSILYNHRVGVRVMVFNATFNNIFYIVGVSFIGGENRSTWSKQPTCSHRHAATDMLYHIMLYRVYIACAGFKFTTLVVIATDYMGSYKSNYHTITTTKLLLLTRGS